MSVKVHEAFSIDSFQDRLLWWDDFLGDQLQDEWRTLGTGTAAVVDAQTGGIVRLTTGAVNGNQMLIDWNNIRSLHVDQKVTMEVRMKLTQTTLLSVFFGLRFDDNNRIHFWYSTAAAHTSWHIRTLDGGVPTDADTTTAVDTDYHIFRIECLPTGEVHFYIDDVETTNSPITTNIPDDAADFFMPRLILITREAAAKSMDFDYVVVRQEI